MKRRVVITGMGTVAPGGIGLDRFWRAIRDGIPSTDRVSQFDCDELPSKIAAEVRGFDPYHYINAAVARRMERCTQFVLCAAMMAYEDSGITIDSAMSRRTGVFEGTSLGSLSANLAMHRRLLLEGGSRVSPSCLISGMNGNASSSIALEYHLHGPAITFSEGSVSSAYAVGYGFRKIQHGELDVAFVGGGEAPISKEMFQLFSSARLLSRQNESPSTACNPFDVFRDGFVMGEGGAMLILEELDRALGRGARIYAEIVGFGETTDAYHPTSPAPDGEMIAEAMRLALDEAHLQPSEIDYLNAHGTGTQMNDVVETRAIKKAFDGYACNLPISSSKATVGHLLGACGAVEVVVCALSIQNQWIPPTANLQTPDSQCDLDYVPNQGRPSNLRAVMSNNYSFGGRNSSIVLKQFLN